jgi:predicted membrane protein
MFGLLIILIGVVFTLDNLNVVSADRFLAYWPAGLILIGGAKLWQVRTGHGSPIGGVFFVLAGTWMLLQTLDVIDVSIISFWPLLLVLAGGVVVWHSIRAPRSHGGVASDSVVNAIAILSGVQRGSNSRQFRGGELTAFMGGCGVDLRRAEINGEAVIDVFAMWGGIDIRVPESWNVIARVTPIMGGYEDATRSTGDARAHTLIIRGIVVMGGVEVKN